MSANVIRWSRGSIVRKSDYRPKARLFSALTVSWLAISTTALDVLVQVNASPLSDVGLACCFFVLPVPVFAFLAIFHGLTETARTFTQRFPDTNHA